MDKKRQKHEDEFTQLQRYTVIVADTGDIESIRKYKPQDATTNPSLLYKAAQMPQYNTLIEDAIQYGLRLPSELDDAARVEAIMDRLAINFGKEITTIVPGYVSTELDARLRFVKLNA
jgi:transaldolase